jgi:hypothetical protein
MGGGEAIVYERTISKTDSRTCDNWMAREHDVVVLPGHKGKITLLHAEGKDGGMTHLRLPFHLHESGRKCERGIKLERGRHAAEYPL